MDVKKYDLLFLRDYFNSDYSAMLPILKMYAAETPAELITIHQYLVNNDITAAKAATHKIKMNVAMLGIPDESAFIDTMHLLKPAGQVTSEVLQRFFLFQKTIMTAIEEIRQDFSL